jgi:hypothetical protein
MRLKNNLTIRKIAEENVLIMQGQYGIDMTKVISFNETAEWLWNQLSGKDFTLEDVTALLTENFNVDAAKAETDAQRWIEKLESCKAFV